MENFQTIWPLMRADAAAFALAEPLLSSFYHSSVLNHDTFNSALTSRLATQIVEGQATEASISALSLRELLLEVSNRHPDLLQSALADSYAYFDRDPACDSYCRPLLFYKGFVAIQAHRFAHRLWSSGRQSIARFIQHQISVDCDVDIHPAAQLGDGIMLDHGTGLVIGETAIVGDQVSLMHGVTLGGTGNQTGKRHPTVGSGVLIAAGAKVLGDISIGDGAKIGAGSVVLRSVPAHTTVAGVPAKKVGKVADSKPALSMDQRL